MKRDPARKVPLSALLVGELRRGDGEYDPTTLHLGETSFSRANVMGIVISASNGALMIEDGTAQIDVRSFEPVPGMDKVTVGDPVMIIGKPREYNGARYLMPEICKKIDQGWLAVRKQELTGFSLPEEKKPEEGQPAADEKATGTDAVVAYLKEKDDGSGVKKERLLADLPGSAEAIEALLRDGELFENMPGTLKLLE